MIYGERDTKHFYVINDGDSVEVKKVNGFGDGEKFRIVIKNSAGDITGTTDIIDKKLISWKKCTSVAPTYYRKWIVKAPDSIEKDTTYKLFFYLENLYGFGIQDKWDKVVISKVGSNGNNPDKDVMQVMTELKDKLYDAINLAGPIKNDFVINMISNDIVILENLNSATYTFDNMEMYTHDVPYSYDLVLSTLKENKETSEPWTDKVIMATNTTTIRMTSGKKVKNMEHYFMRGRGDRYDFTPNFKTNIINNLYAKDNVDYNTLDIHYAYQDGQGKNYNSEKDLTFAYEKASTLSGNSAFLNAFGMNSGDITAVTSHSDAFEDFVGITYINNTESWKLHKDILNEYFEDQHKAGNNPAPNEASWNGDGWLIFNMAPNTYNGKTMTPKYNGDSLTTAPESGTFNKGTYAIYSVTTDGDMGSAGVQDIDTFDVTKVTVK